MLNDTAIVALGLGFVGWVMAYSNPEGNAKFRFVALATVSIGFYVAGHFGTLPDLVANAMAALQQTPAK